MATFTLSFTKKFALEVSGFSSLYIRFGSFERFWNTAGFPSH
ncbi:hypothetical protein C8R31_10499 [Nitrosospira sp. Nsp2]|nr:hypothetical protein [Nitrosospira sp. Nsp2]PTR15072.1 hypothetical protein C8R31_10499 [Nitrosospira sp. Nsp2]